MSATPGKAAAMPVGAMNGAAAGPRPAALGIGTAS